MMMMMMMMMMMKMMMICWLGWAHITRTNTENWRRYDWQVNKKKSKAIPVTDRGGL
jgi:hypothetical protein